MVMLPLMQYLELDQMVQATAQTPIELLQNRVLA